MGTETWARNIEYPANWRDTLGTLILKSKWANIEIYNLGSKMMQKRGISYLEQAGQNLLWQIP